jgi:chloramphenicol-sensitive protein RarD
MNKGIGYAIGAYLLWGILPVYWKLLDHVPAFELLLHRITWSFLLLIVIVLASKRWRTFREAISSPRVIGIYLIAALFLGGNWLLYIWAVNADFIVETSLGYFINPLVYVLLGVVFLGERLRPIQWVSIGLAAGGVLYLTVSYGALPWIALTLAFSFGLYGLIKKTAPLDSLHSLTLETGILLLPALGTLIYFQVDQQAAFLNTSLTSDLLMFGTGLVSATPLLLFAMAARRIPLSMIGLLQYIAPTMQLILGVLVYHEPFTQVRQIGFSLVWVALAIYWGEGWWVKRHEKVVNESSK